MVFSKGLQEYLMVDRGEIGMGDDVYRALQLHLDSMPAGFPATESGVEIRILRQLFTPEEAKLATKLKYSTYPNESLESIFNRLKDTGLSLEELEGRLDIMASKGLIHSKSEAGEKSYSGAQWVVGIYEFQVNKLTKELSDDIHRYNNEAFGMNLFSARPTQLRVIPIGKSVKPKDEVASYDDFRAMLSTVDEPIMVTSCICRQRKDLADSPCKVTEREETCISFGEFAQMYIDQGWGREISRDELLEIIEMNEQEGLVLQPSNSQKPEFICSCCGCCCGLLRGKRAMPKPVDFFSTNYHSAVDLDLCTSCGTCVDLCQMRALSFKDDALTIDLDRCIGCGVCVANCPEEAMSLLKRDKEIVPPETMEETFSRIAENKPHT
jgi:Pyruvate/2-oxoacid:ferredoxin oxidoreductase delta subunit